MYPLERRVGSFKFGARRCQVCLNVTETEMFTSTSTNQTYKINHKFNCNERSLIYLLMCKICRMLDKQLISFAVDGIIIKVMTNYLVGEPCMQEHIFERFNSEGHAGCLENVSVTFIDKTDSQNPEKRENYWIHTFITMVPWCLKFFNSV